MSETELPPHESYGKNRTRIVVCAACKHKETGLVLMSARHWDTNMRLVYKALGGVPKDTTKYIQGFIDQWGTFMDREESMLVALSSGQNLDLNRGCEGGEILYSECLY